MIKREIPPLHAIARLEYKYKLFFFLSELGINSAKQAGVIAHQHYMFFLAEIMVGG